MGQKRTEQQNKALHKGFELLADALNDAGFETKAVLAKKQIDVPWNKELVKELLWRPLMEAARQHESTTELTTAEVSEIWDILNRHLGEKFGVTVDFPHDPPG